MDQRRKAKKQTRKNSKMFREIVDKIRQEEMSDIVNNIDEIMLEVGKDFKGGTSPKSVESKGENPSNSFLHKRADSIFIGSKKSRKKKKGFSDLIFGKNANESLLKLKEKNKKKAVKSKSRSKKKDPRIILGKKPRAKTFGQSNSERTKSPKEEEENKAKPAQNLDSPLQKSPISSEPLEIFEHREFHCTSDAQKKMTMNLVKRMRAVKRLQEK